AQRARRVARAEARTSAARRTNRQLAGRTTTQVLLDRSVGRSRAGRLVVFQAPLLFRTVNLAKIVDASVLLRRGARPNEVRDRDRSEEADDRHNDHDFHERKARLTGGLNLHTNLFAFLFLRSEHGIRWFIFLLLSFTYCLLPSALGI